MPKHKPPSRIKYEKTHPLISTRLDEETYKKLKEMLKTANKPFSEYLREIVKGDKKEWNKAYQEGYDKGKKDWRIWYLCSVCNKPIYITPKGGSHVALMKYLNESGWLHASCEK